VARIDAQFIIQTALDAATADSEGSVIVWAERHGIDPEELIAALKVLTEAHRGSEADEQARAAYFLRLGYELRRRQQDEPPSMMGDVKLRDYMLGIARNFVEAERNLDKRANKQTVLEGFFNVEAGSLTG
jgi:hypothetical protein